MNDDSLINGDSKFELKKIKSNSIDLIVTDPPYRINFMQKEFDKDDSFIDIWKECLRVLKPGAFAFIMCATRSDKMVELINELEEVGFNIKFTPIYWTYATGFPKATNISKMVDKRLGVEPTVIGKRGGRYATPLPDIKGGKYIGGKSGSYDGSNETQPTSKEAKELDGSYAGFQPKPAVEVVLVAMKPLSEGSYLDQAMFNKKGISWLDDGRIPTNDILKEKRNFKGSSPNPNDHASKGGSWGTTEIERSYSPNDKGRFPANLLVSDDILNDDDEETFSRYYDLDAWFNKFAKQNLPKSIQKTFPFIITPKPSASEKNKGLFNLPKKKAPIKDFRPTLETNPENWKTPIQETPYGGANRGETFQNDHPTVKPIKLMSYLITIGSRKGNIVLDPFIGSGTTAIACVLTDRKYIGIELDENYFNIALNRLFIHKKEKEKVNRKEYYSRRL